MRARLPFSNRISWQVPVTSPTSTSSTSKFSAGAAQALPGPDWLRQSRQASWERFSASELPRESEEIWRYSRIEELELSRYGPCPPGGEVAIDELPGELQALVGAVGAEATVLVSHNGGEGRILNPQNTLRVAAFGDAPLGVGTPPAPVLNGPAADIWTALNSAFVQVPWRVTVAAGDTVERPLVVVHWFDRDGCAVFPRIEVEVGDNASLRVVEIIASPDVDVLSVPVAHLHLHPGARLGFGHVQLLGGRAWQLGNQVSRVGKDATLRSMTVALGGHYARERTDSVLGARGPTANYWPPSSVPGTRCTTCARSSTMPLPTLAPTCFSRVLWPTSRTRCIRASSVWKRGHGGPMPSRPIGTSCFPRAHKQIRCQPWRSKTTMCVARTPLRWAR